jgi:hypothetical protein
MRCLGLGITGILIMGASVAHQDTQLEGTERGSECKYFNSATTALAFGCVRNDECEVLSVPQLLYA